MLVPTPSGAGMEGGHHSRGRGTMLIKVHRAYRAVSVQIGSTTSISSTARLIDMAGSVVLIHGHTASATITIWGSMDDATYGQLVIGGHPATITLPSGAAMVAMPGATIQARGMRLLPDASAVPFVRLVSDRQLPGISAVMMAKS